MTKKRKNKSDLPDYEIDSLARVLLPAIQKLFETDEGKKAFKKWQAEKQQKQLNNQLNKKESHLSV